MRVWVDSDGVLADFNRRWFEFWDKDAETMRAKMGKEALWNHVRETDPLFFERLYPMHDAAWMMDKLWSLNPIILTGSPTEWGYGQKFDWAEKHFPTTRILVCEAKHKHLFAKRGDILIDDRTKYKHLWESVGGVFIHHINAKHTINHMIDLGLVKS